jgi:hypothetical protein
MRLALPVLSLLICACPALAQPSPPRDPVAKDGLFSICAFQKFDQCDLLTEQSIQKYRFSPAEKRTLQDLRRFAEASRVKVEDLEKSFGKSSAARPNKTRPDEKTIAWFANSNGAPKAKCPECGIYVYLTGDVVTGINYMVDGKFTLTWNRAEQPKPPR